MQNLNLYKLLSKSRLSSYNSYEDYLENIAYSQSYYVRLHLIEVTFRNKLNRILIDVYGENWLLNTAILNTVFDNKASVIINTQIKLIQKKAHTHDDIVAHLNFGIWIAILLDHRQKLAKKDFTKLFNLNRTQINKLLDKLCNELLTIKNFRNRVFHYEKVNHHINYRNISRLIDKFIMLLDIDGILSNSIKTTNEIFANIPIN